jgi:phage I-like protein
MKHLIALLTLELNQAGGVIQLFPAGAFRARDGRPAEVEAWILTADIAQRLIAEADARQTPYVLDYEHQSLLTEKNGQPAPAAAFFKKLEWRDEGLFATDVDWTPRAKEMVEAGEYRFISPVFYYDDETGHILGIISAALTNSPALDGMDSVRLAAATLNYPDEDTTVDELMERLRWMLNLPIAATKDEIIAQLNRLISQLSGTEALTAEQYDLLAVILQKEDIITTLTAQVANPDPAKFVPVETMNAAIAEAVARAGTASEEALAQQEAETLITTALSDGRLLPAQEAWAKALAKSDPASLKSYIEKTPAIPALMRSQTGGNQPAGVPGPGDDPDDTVDPVICSLMGTDPADVVSYLKGAQ